MNPLQLGRTSATLKGAASGALASNLIKKGFLPVVLSPHIIPFSFKIYIPYASVEFPRGPEISFWVSQSEFRLKSEQLI